MGWVFLLLLAAVTGVLLWRIGLPRSLFTFAGAALMLGAAGYALQGSPALPGTKAQPAIPDIGGSAEMSELRLRMFGRFTVAEPFFVAADALSRSGNGGSAVNLLLGGVNASPDNAALWTALGTAYVEHDGGSLSPPARFAFDRALKLAPEHPGPPFFLGMALIGEGKLREARRWWARAYRLTPTGISYRRDIGERLQILDQFLASPAGPAMP